jgi:hypothetical protein
MSRVPALVLVLLSTAVFAAPIIVDGDVPDGGADFVLVPFEVPAGTQEVSVTHPILQSENILDYGLFDPAGYRGWGGGNSEPMVVGALAASRSYLTGPMTPGTWNVIIGKAKIVTWPAHYHLEIDLRPTATLAPQPERRPFVPGPALEPSARWYAGDLHVHSLQSGDAQPTIDAVATFARARSLDFVELSDHNTVAQLDYLGDAQSRHPQLLLVPGVEFTTYAGHANGIGATAYVDHRFGVGQVTFEGAVQAFASQHAVFSINHPMLDLGNNCIGCAWKHPIPRASLGGVEIGTGGWDKTGVLFTTSAIAFWDRIVAQGIHATALGGSDDHSGGTGVGAFDSPIGNPTTMVFAKELSVSAVVDGIRAGHTVVKLQGPDDPMVELVTADGHRVGDSVSGPFDADLTVTSGSGAQLVLVRDGVEIERTNIAMDSLTLTRHFDPPSTGESRLRAEVWVAGQPRTVSSHLYVLPSPAASKQGCAQVDGLATLVAVLVLLRRRHRP